MKTVAAMSVILLLGSRRSSGHTPRRIARRRPPDEPKPWGRLAVALVLALAGVGLIAYPRAQNWLYNREMHEAKLEFVAMTQGDPAQAGDDQPGLVDVEGLYRFMQQENQRLYETGQSGLIDAWSYQEAGVDLSHYGIDDGCVGFITIARINVEIPIYLGANTANMDKGAVHLTETSYPIGGMNTNAVIAAHRGQVRWMFRDIDKLEVGDTVTITNFREQLTYRVVSYEVIDPHDSGKVHIQAGKDMITLISCHPLGSNYQRYVVYCERVP